MKIGIIGLGLIGGSLLKSLSNKGFEVFGVSRNKETLSKAQEYCIAVSDDINLMASCDVVFVAVPMSKVLGILDKLSEILPKDVIVADVSSLKEFVMNKDYPFTFVGTHPMAGTEKSGFDASFPTLFNGAKWVITPKVNTEEKVLNILKHIIGATGATVITADAQAHDEAVAKISHMPMVLSQALFEMVKGDELALKLASSGFRDMTRLAMSNIDMACDMVDMNNENIQKALCKFGLTVDDLQDNYREKIVNIASERLNMYNDSGQNKL